MASRLVMLDGSRIITADELKPILTGIGFDVPDVAPVKKLYEYDAYKVRFTIPVTDPDYNRLYNEYILARNTAYNAYKADLNRWQQDINDVAMFLDGIFEMATKVVVGLNPDGTKKYEWQIITPSAYTFPQAAQKLTGATKPANEIDFICYGKF